MFNVFLRSFSALLWKLTATQKRHGCIGKRASNNAFDLVVLKVIQCIFLKMACNSTRLGAERNRVTFGIWRVGCGGGTYRVCMGVFNVTLGSFCALISKWPVTQKWPPVQRNGVTFWTRSGILVEHTL